MSVSFQVSDHSRYSTEMNYVQCSFLARHIITVLRRVGSISYETGRRYSAVLRFWPVGLALLSDGPTGRGEVARGGCLYAWNVPSLASNP
jgi:hypothetical protein